MANDTAFKSIITSHKWEQNTSSDYSSCLMCEVVLLLKVKAQVPKRPITFCYKWGGAVFPSPRAKAGVFVFCYWFMGKDKCADKGSVISILLAAHLMWQFVKVLFSAPLTVRDKSAADCWRSRGTVQLLCKSFADGWIRTNETLIFVCFKNETANFVFVEH